MAQSAAMGPPLSPRETRRSGRRSAPSISASASKSPDSDQPPREKVGSSRTAASSANNRNKKLKQEDHDDPVDDRKHPGSTTSSGSNNGSNNSKAKRKTKDKDGDKPTSSVDADIASVEGQLQDGQDEEEEQGITRCVCGSTEDDPDAGEFMVQCETCKVWQHGLCMGYISEDQVHDDDYYCELCKPQMHEDLLKRLAKKPRQTSTASRHDPTAKDRISRSRSPSHLLKQPSKRRNTMNSRDAAFDESLKEIIEATAAEAAAVQDTSVDDISIPVPDINDNGKKKRKRTEDESQKKRTRSASTASDGQRGTAPPLEPPSTDKVALAPKSSGARNKRGGRKTATVEAAPAESEEVHQADDQARALVLEAPTHQTAPTFTVNIARRNQSGTGTGQQGTSAADARAYRNSHAYAVSQQTLFTSWNLPDYLSHLEQMLPTDVPQPLEVRAGAPSGSLSTRGESAERTMERGVKVKWPAKRMSVGDMNKRVRALVEWVGREQASALDRGRRREALEKSLREQPDATPAEPTGSSEDVAAPADTDAAMLVDDNPLASEPQNLPTKTTVESNLMSESALEMSAQTMKMMEELMEELIGFQERFGPGAKTRDRERRLAA
ncbi:hypothetical protein BJ912DRAFT_1122906 [Pholiota molesta]|nr:hypothetical protein BJ912DRAFT_1122906 [Pholiota molesta]